MLPPMPKEPWAASKKLYQTPIRVPTQWSLVSKTFHLALVSYIFNFSRIFLETSLLFKDESYLFILFLFYPYFDTPFFKDVKKIMIFFKFCFILNFYSTSHLVHKNGHLYHKWSLFIGCKQSDLRMRCQTILF